MNFLKHCTKIVNGRRKTSTLYKSMPNYLHHHTKSPITKSLCHT